MDFKLLNYQSGDTWFLKEPDDIEIGDELPKDQELVVESLGVCGTMLWSSEEEHWVVYWDETNDVPEGACLTVDYEPDEKEEEPQPEYEKLKEVKDCSNLKNYRLLLLDNCNEAVGYVTYDSLLECIKSDLKLCDLIDLNDEVGTPIADKYIPLIDTNCNVTVIKSTNMCCEPVPDVEPSCE